MFNRNELIQAVVMATNATHADAEAIVEAILGAIIRAVRVGDRVELRGFGTFATRQRRARMGRNPKTGARIEVPAKRVPYFKPSSELLALINRSSDFH